MRAVVAALMLSCLAACHEEPTIVIKFEPNDLAGAAARPVDLGAPAAARAVADLAVAAADKSAHKKPALECKKAADCVVVPAECCDCANGGKQHAIAKKELAEAKTARAERCKGKMCTMMMSTDPSCGQRPDCVDGACVMVKKK
jgi:hypothetical protein